MKNNEVVENKINEMEKQGADALQVTQMTILQLFNCSF